MEILHLFQYKIKSPLEGGFYVFKFFIYSEMLAGGILSIKPA